MAFDYPESAKGALRLITRFGRDVQILRFAGGTQNKATGVISGGADRVGTIKAVILPATRRNINDMDGKYAEEMIRGNIRFVIAEAVNVPYSPRTGDRLKFDNEEWESVGVTPIEPAGTAVIYKMGIIKR